MAASSARAAMTGVRKNNNNSGGFRGRMAELGAQVTGNSQPQANDHTHEENNSVPSGGMTGVGGGIQPGLQGLATAVTGNPQGVGAASSQPQLRGGDGMAANKAAMVQAGASNVASQNQAGQDMFGGQSLPEKGAIGVAGMDRMEQF